MTIFTFSNNVSTTLAGPISPSATSLTLSSAAHLPASIPTGQVLVITLNDVATEQNFEIIYATSISGATLSGLLRGQEGTAALSWATNDFAYSSPTAGQQAGFGQLSANNAWTGGQDFVGNVTASSNVSITGPISSNNSNTWTGQNSFSSPVTVGSASQPSHALNLGQFLASLNSSGSVNIPVWDGANEKNFILKWGIGTTPSTGTSVSTTNVIFPLAFPNACVFASVNALGSANSTNGGNPSSNAHSYSTTGFIAIFDVLGYTVFNQAMSFSWFAIGY